MVSQAQVHRAIGSCGVITICLYLSGGCLTIMALAHAKLCCVCVGMCVGRSVLTCVVGLKDLTYFGEQCEQRVCRGRGEH